MARPIEKAFIAARNQIHLISLLIDQMEKEHKRDERFDVLDSLNSISELLNEIRNLLN